jgi:hypothetical protein
MMLLPERLSPETKSPGERQVFRLLKDSTSLDAWFGLHSLGIKQDFLDGETEADFLILAPELGILCLEIKACKTLGFDGTNWHLGNKTETRGPYKQASNAKWRIMNELERAGIDMRQVPVVSGVWFTEISVDEIPKSIERYSHETLCAEDLSRDIEKVLTEFIRAGRNSLTHNFPANVPTHPILERIVELLRPRFTARQHPSRLKQEIEEYASQALNEQLLAYSAVNEHRSVVIDALAGTGKTFLACQFAREAAIRDERVLLLCHNKLLAGHLQDNLKSFRNIKVDTVTGLMAETAIGGGNHISFGDKDPRWWSEELPQLALSACADIGDDQLFDSVVFDEAQDIGEESWLKFVDALLRGGLESCERVLVLGDFSNQDLFTSGFNSKEKFVSAIGAPVVYTNAFRVNCRNPIRVGQWVSAHLGLEPNWADFRRQDSNGRPRMITDVMSDEDVRRSAELEIRDAAGKYPLEDIVVLSAQPSTLEDLILKMKMPATKLSHPKTNRLRYGSPFEFKGLEALCVILVEFMGPNSKLRESFYVSSTRTLGDFSAIVPKVKLDQLRGAQND